MRSIRIVWMGNEYIWQYAVEIEKQEDGIYKNYLREYTTETFLNVSILPGVYRYTIIPYDVLDRSGEGTRWIDFVIHGITDTTTVTDIEQVIYLSSDDLIDEFIPEIIFDREQENENIITTDEIITESNEIIRLNRFNTLGVSLGTAFTDPFIITTLHGTFAPIDNVFIELGCDAGFISRYEGVESFYCLYPYVNLGYFLPFRNMGGIFTSVGIGYIFGSYFFSHGGNADLNILTGNVTIGVNLFNFINIFYSLRTDFTAISHKIAVGYVYRFRQAR